MSKQVVCPGCGCRLKASERVVNKEVGCPLCGVRFIVRPYPPLPRVQRSVPANAHEANFNCLACGDSFPLPPEQAGQQVLCRTCGVPGAPLPQKPSEGALPPEPEVLADSSGGAAASPDVRGRVAAFVLWGVGAFLLLVAIIAYLRLEAEEDQLARLDDANYRLGQSLSTLTGRPAAAFSEHRRSDRTHVYVLTVLGAVFVGLGFVVWSGTSYRPNRMERLTE